MSTYRLMGRITSPEGKPLEGLTVLAFDLERSSPEDFLREALTNEDGRYLIVLDDALFRPLDRPGGERDVFVRVLLGDKLLGQSEARRLGGRGISISLRVDPSASAQPQAPALSVSGVVRQSDGRPVAKAIVRAVHKQLRRETALGEKVKTDSSGRFSIAYKAADFGKQGRANLVVRAFNAKDVLLAESAVVFQAKARERIDLTIKPPEDKRPLHERLLRQLVPLTGGTAIADLGEEDVAFLASDSGIPSAQVERTVMAERAARFASLPAAAFHGYLEARSGGQQDALLRYWTRLTDDFRMQADDMARFRFLAQAGESGPGR